MQLNITPLVGNLLIMNLAVFAAQFAGADVVRFLGLYYPASPNFYPYQFLTYMFTHGEFFHLFSNMFGLFMFGPLLEQHWGGQRFLLFYLVTGVGAGLVYTGINFYELHQLEQSMRLVSDSTLTTGTGAQLAELYQLKLSIPMVGASGAIFGILMAFGLLFPNTELFLLFFPFPIKAKVFVLLYGLYELFQGVRRVPGDNVAHFAHLGGMLFAFILIWYWRKDRNNFY